MKDVPFDEEFYTTPVEEVTFDLEEILVGLTPGQRELLLMTKIEGYSYQEASTKLKISIPSAKVGVHRIVETLKKRFEK